MTKLAAIFCVVALASPTFAGRQQGYFAPQPPPVVAVPQPPQVYQPPPVIYQPPPRLVPVQQQGVWVPVSRPTRIGQLLFGPVWTFVPYQQQQTQ